MYELKIKVKDEHIDFQGIVDGLYYPFYFEECRHKYINDVLGINIVEYAKRGLNLVLSEYTLKFKNSLKKGDELTVTCQIVPSENSRLKFAFEQKIFCEGKVAAEGTFTGTCVPASGGRPSVPEEIKNYLASNPVAS